MLLDGDDWQAKFRDFQTEAWRLETLPQYLVQQEAEEFAAFKAGARFPGPYVDSWTEMVSTRNVGRVHIVRRPLSAYLRFEFERYYQHQASAGEDIRILDLTDRPNPLPDDVGDYWMFDRSTVVFMRYEDDGRQIGRELYEGDPAPFIEYQRLAIAQSVPFLEYVKSE